MVNKANDSQLQRCAFLVALLLTPTAHAVDGVIEINQPRALAGGVTPGDLPGFPVSINAPGSYRLTGNLMPGSTNAIVDSLAAPVDDVTIDLNGFTIDGKGSTTNGIQLSGGNNWEIRNGTVKGFANGIQQQVSSSGHRVIGVRALDNSRNGIGIANGEGHMIKDCTVSRNGTGNLDRGLAIGANSTVIGNTVMNNSGNGMSLGAGTGYGNNVVNNNGGTVAGGVEMGTNVCDGNTTCP